MNERSEVMDSTKKPKKKTGISIKVKDKEARSMLRNMIDRARNRDVALRYVASEMRNDVLNHFDTQEGEDGRQWPDLKPKTWEQKRKDGHYRMLVNSGNLRRRNVPWNDNDKAKVVNDMEYAEAQNFGNKNMPARTFMWLSDNRLRKIVRYMINYLAGGL